MKQISITIQSKPAIFHFPRAPHEFISVRDAIDIDKAMGDPENINVCPLCNEGFSPRAFRAHAKPCINARAPRRKIWVPAGTKNAIAAFPEKRMGV